MILALLDETKAIPTKVHRYLITLKSVYINLSSCPGQYTNKEKSISFLFLNILNILCYENFSCKSSSSTLETDDHLLKVIIFEGRNNFIIF